MATPGRTEVEGLLDEASLACCRLLAGSLEFGFGFATTVDWWGWPDPRPPAPSRH